MKRHITSSLSLLFGKFADKEFHPALQRLINKSYIKIMRLDMSRFESYDSYPSLNALFTRELLEEIVLPNDAGAIVAPVDALITQTGSVEDATALQIKGMRYSIKRLLGTYLEPKLELLEGGIYANYYLAPNDYHRYHAPCDLKVASISYMPGKLYPVNIPYLKKKANLFIENERVVLECYDTNDQLHILALIGALNVGRIKLNFLPNYQSTYETSHYRFDRPIALQRGEMFGWFEMGSTLVHLCQKEATTCMLQVNQKVRAGQIVGYLKVKE